MLAEVTTRKLRALVTAEAVDALTGGNDGPFVEQREGVYRAGLALHEYYEYLFPLGLLINEFGGVLETAQRWRREGAEGVDGNVLKGALNAVVGLPRMRFLCTLTERADTSVLHVSGVVDAIGRLLPQDVQALAVDGPHASVPETSGLHPQGKASGAFPGTIRPPAPPPSRTSIEHTSFPLASTP